MNSVWKMEAPYLNRREAGMALAACLRGDDIGQEPVVLALPRGGVPVAAEVAEALDLPLEVFIVRKLGMPGYPEIAMGAIASGGVQLLDEALIKSAGITPAQLAMVIDQEHEELRRREQVYRPRRMLSLGWRPAIIVDDGLATGFTMRAAVAALRRTGCPRITVAVPVGAAAVCAEFARDVDMLVCPLQPEEFQAVGQWYEDFHETTDEEVAECLARVAWAHGGTMG
jgi:putative phosphoribosyl transferase